jgi:hypothetical protein
MLSTLLLLMLLVESLTVACTVGTHTPLRAAAWQTHSAATRDSKTAAIASLDCIRLILL